MGVIALITIPIIKDIINSSREKNFKNSALGLIEAANEYYLNSKLTNDSFEEITFKVNNGKMVSEDRELVFNGKVPVGDSYVKIKSNGDIAINITDGEYFAVKDYDEVGVSTGVSEDNALLREELAKKITELESELDKTKEELNDKIANNTNKINENTSSISSNKEELEDSINTSKEELTSKINTNKTELQTSINNLTNKSNDNNIFLQTYPVGSIYISTSSTNPGTIYGGTWERYGSGKTLVGVNESETEFATVNKTGGEKTHKLTINEMPSHNHNTWLWLNEEASSDFILRNDNQAYITPSIFNYGYERSTKDGKVVYGNPSNAGLTSSIGGFQAHNNLQPYITVYMFKRVS